MLLVLLFQLLTIPTPSPFLPPSIPTNQTDDPSSVLLVVNDAVPSETGTGGIGASQWVANEYIRLRRVPSTNIVHLNIALSNNDPLASDSWTITWTNFKDNIRTPIATFLENNNLKFKIKYIVTTYGVPSHISGHPDSLSSPMSVDSFLVNIYHPNPNNITRTSAYWNSIPTNLPKPFRNFITTYLMYLVTRLDGPSAVLSAGLVSKAVAAEQGITRSSGTGYFDYRNNAATNDSTMLNAYNKCVSEGLTCYLNTQTISGGMITNAPDALWVWGWYSANTVNDVYTFSPGAVGSQLTSYTAQAIRYPNNGNWVELFIRRGITATWGATGEPTSAGYALGDNLLYKLWKGYNFAEACYISNQYNNWMMVFLGDPLYRIKFKAEAE